MEAIYSVYLKPYAMRRISNKAADSLAAFIEAYVAIRNGNYSHEFQEAKVAFRSTYGRANIAGINLVEIYADFD